MSASDREHMKIFAGTSGKNVAEMMCTHLNIPAGEATTSLFPDGEVFVNLHNIGTTRQVVRAGDKIAQGVVVPVVPVRFVETSNDNIYDWWPITISARGDGALGSTGD